jgi:hypothetical protein
MCHAFVRVWLLNIRGKRGCACAYGECVLPMREMWEEGHGEGKLGGGEKGCREGGYVCNGVKGRDVFVNGSSEIDTPSLTTDIGDLKAPHIVRWPVTALSLLRPSDSHPTRLFSKPSDDLPSLTGSVCFFVFM